MSEYGRGPAEVPARPAIPPLLYCAVACIASLWIRLWSGFDLGVGALAAVLAASVLSLLLGWRSGRAWAHGAALVFAGVALGLALGGVELGRQGSAAAVLGSSPVSTCGFITTSDTREGDYGFSCTARVYREGRVLGEVRLSLPADCPSGTRISGVGRFESCAPGAEEGDSEWSASLRTRGFFGSVRINYLRECERADAGPLPLSELGRLPAALRARVLGTLSGGADDAHALACALTLNHRGLLRERGLDEVFASCGISHLVAISGAHLALISVFLDAALMRLRLRPRARCLGVLSLTAFFVLACGIPASAVRAWVMCSVAYVARLSGRRGDALSSLSLAALVMCTFDPGCVGDAGFLLSMSCVFALSVFGMHMGYAGECLLPTPRLPARLPRSVRMKVQEIWRTSRSQAGVSILALAASLPVTAPVFGTASGLTVLVNALVGPLLSVFVALSFTLVSAEGAAALCAVVAPGVVGSALSAPLLLVMAVSAVALNAFCGLCRALAAIPMLRIVFPDDMNGALLWCAVGICFSALYLLWPEVDARRVRYVALVVVLVVGALTIRWRFFAPAQMVVLDVGQGDAILIRDGPSALLVDTGPPDLSLVRALQRNKVFHLDAVIITHLHDDHYGGLLEAPGYMSVRKVVVAEGVEVSGVPELRAALGELGVSETAHVSCGDELRIGGFRLRVLAPAEPVDGMENVQSLQLYLSYGDDRGGLGADPGMTALLTGDAETDALERAMAELRRTEGSERVDVLKLGHHGSELSLTPEQARRLSPVLAVASAGEGNSYGHPSQEAIQAVEAAGARFLCTIGEGDIKIRP